MGDGGVEWSSLWLWRVTVNSLGELIGLHPSSHKPLTCFASKRCVNNWLVGLLTCSNRPLKALLKFLKSFIKGGNCAFYHHQSSPRVCCSKKYMHLIIICTYRVDKQVVIRWSRWHEGCMKTSQGIWITKLLYDNLVFIVLSKALYVRFSQWSCSLRWCTVGVGIFSHLHLRYWESRSDSRTILDLPPHPPPY